ncbi:MAG: SDR family NAD(P)-dependent oxidoreductase, partial [Spirochaetia bacterium]|nr:SDR family NAD(P)-dependent oxidoreductase [Spirochaetia bacterium]
DFNGKTVYITGGGSGIGLETGKRLLAGGARLVVFDLKVSDAALKALRSVRPADKTSVRDYKLDVTDQDKVIKAFLKAAKDFGSPDVVFNSAGIVSAVETMRLKHDEWDRVIRVNLYGSKNVARAAGEVLKPGGRLALVASLAGIVGSYGYPAYSASKFGVVGLAQVLRMEWKPKGLGVSVICPPEVETPMVVTERQTRPKVVGALKAFAGTLTVEAAVAAILQGLEREQFLIIPGGRAKLTNFLVRFAPLWLNHAIADGIVAKALRQG